VSNHADPAGDHAVTTDLGAAGDAGATRHRGVVPHLHVVRNHDLIVQLHTVTDQRVGKRAAINGGIGAYFDIIADTHAADLCNLLPSALLLGETEPLTTDHCTRLDHHALAYQHIVIKRDPRSQSPAFADPAARPDERLRTNHDIRVDGGTCLDHHIRPDTGRWVNVCVGRDQCGGMDATGRLRAGLEQVRGPSIGKIGVADDDSRAFISLGIRRRQQHCSGLGSRQVLAVLGIGQEAQLRWTRFLQGREPIYDQGSVTTQAATQLPGQLTECENCACHVSAADSCAR